jgi:hypothetical protein
VGNLLDQVRNRNGDGRSKKRRRERENGEQRIENGEHGDERIRMVRDAASEGVDEEEEEEEEKCGKKTANGSVIRYLNAPPRERLNQRTR